MTDATRTDLTTTDLPGARRDDATTDVDARAADLRRLGFAVVPLLDPADLAALREVAAEHLPQPPDRFWSTSRDPDLARRRTVHDRVAGVLAPRLAQVVPGYRTALCSLVAKPPRTAAGEVPMHQDWSFVDDRRDVSYNVWCPLEDVDETNGCLALVAGSHASARQPRAVGSPFFYASLETVLRAHLRSVPMRAGDALVFDHCLVHYSPPNASDRLRVAATAVLLPVGVPMRWYQATGTDGEVEVYEVPDDVHLRHDPGAPPPDGVRVGRLRTGLVTSG